MLPLERLDPPEARRALDELARGPEESMVVQAVRKAVARRGGAEP
jgi:hypothetical protein